MLNAPINQSLIWQVFSLVAGFEKNGQSRVSESWTGIGVVTACFARVLMVHWPRVQRVDSTS